MGTAKWNKTKEELYVRHIPPTLNVDKVEVEGRKKVREIVSNGDDDKMIGWQYPPHKWQHKLFVHPVMNHPGSFSINGCERERGRHTVYQQKKTERVSLKMMNVTMTETSCPSSTKQDEWWAETFSLLRRHNLDRRQVIKWMMNALIRQYAAEQNIWSTVEWYSEVSGFVTCLLEIVVSEPTQTMYPFHLGFGIISFLSIPLIRLFHFTTASSQRINAA